jgi:hypothetical protein
MMMVKVHQCCFLSHEFPLCLCFCLCLCLCLYLSHELFPYFHLSFHLYLDLYGLDHPLVSSLFGP